MKAKIIQTGWCYKTAEGEWCTYGWLFSASTMAGLFESGTLYGWTFEELAELSLKEFTANLIFWYDGIRGGMIIDEIAVRAAWPFNDTRIKYFIQKGV